MPAIKKSMPKRAARKIVQNFGFIVTGAIIVLGIVFWSRQALPVTQSEVTATSAPATVTPSPLPTQTEMVEDAQLSLMPTAQATEAVLEPINWVPLSTVSLSAPFSYEFDGVCTTVPAGWIPFTSNGEKVICENPAQNLGKSLVLPAGVAVVPGYKLPETRITQTPAKGDKLKLPWEVDSYWERYQHTPEKLVRVCLIDEDNEITDTRSIEIVVDEDLSYKPTAAGVCITSLVEDGTLVVFSFLNKINEVVEDGEYKYYEITLDLIIQGGIDQERWLGGKPLTNK